MKIAEIIKLIREASKLKQNNCSHLATSAYWTEDLWDIILKLQRSESVEKDKNTENRQKWREEKERSNLTIRLNLILKKG